MIRFAFLRRSPGFSVPEWPWEWWLGRKVGSVKGRTVVGCPGTITTEGEKF